MTAARLLVLVPLVLACEPSTKGLPGQEQIAPDAGQLEVGKMGQDADPADAMPAPDTAPAAEVGVDLGGETTPADAGPNITVYDPAPSSGGAWTFKAKVLFPGSGVMFRWKYDDGTCGGTPCRNPCPMGPIGGVGTIYRQDLQVYAGTTAAFCAGKTLSDISRGDWLFEVQVGTEKGSASFRLF